MPFFSSEVILGRRKPVILLVPIFFSLLMSFEPSLGVEERTKENNGLGKTPEYPGVSAGQGQENVPLT